MNRLEAATIISNHNLWRRGVEGYAMGDPKELGIAFDIAVISLRELSNLLPGKDEKNDND